MKNDFGCITCQYFKRGEIKFSEPHTDDTCLKHQQVFEKWWEDHKHRKVGAGFLYTPPCFELSERLKPLYEMVDKAEEIHKMLKDINNQPAAPHMKQLQDEENKYSQAVNDFGKLKPAASPWHKYPEVKPTKFGNYFLFYIENGNVVRSWIISEYEFKQEYKILCASRWASIYPPTENKEQ